MIKFDLKTIALIFKVIFLILFITYFYNGLITHPTEGDSIAYHIPIAESVITRGILNPTFYLGFYPSNAETILSFLIFFGIPLNLFNVFGWGILVLLLLKLGQEYGLNKSISWIYSLSVCGLHVFMRWLNTQVIDIWLAVFYTASLIILQRFKGSNKDFFLLGLFTGLTIGTKYSGTFFIFILLFVYIKKIINKLSIFKLLIFFIPFFIFGLTWYLRNLIITGNPIYPQKLFSLNGYANWNIFNVQYWEVILTHPNLVINAILSEYMASPLAIFFLLLYLFILLKNNKGIDINLKKLGIITLFSLGFFLLLPTNREYDIIVSSLRYSYPVIVTATLCIFLLFMNKKFINYIILISIINLLYLPSVFYHPKLIYVTLLVLFIISRSKYLKVN